MPRPLRFNLWQYLDNCITQEDPIPDIRIANLYPSEASVEFTNSAGQKIVHGRCMRAAWLRVKMMENLAKTRSKRFNLPIGEREVLVQATPFTAKTLWTFRAGDKFEDLVKEQMTNAGILLAPHKRFFKDIRYGYLLSGELDAIGKDPNTGEFFGVEVKSIHGYNAEKEVIGTQAIRRLGGKGKPKEDNVLQTAIYAHAWPELPYFKLAYIMRDKVLKAEFDIRVDPDSTQIFIDGDPIAEYTLNDVFSRFATLALHLHNSKLPARDYDLSYTDEQINHMVANGEFARTNAESWTKYWTRKTEVEEGIPNAKGKKQKLLKRPEFGSWRCSYCSYQHFCYDSQGNHKDLDLLGVS